MEPRKTRPPMWSLKLPAPPPKPPAAHEQPPASPQEDARLIADSDAERVSPARARDDGSSDEDAERAPGRTGGKSAEVAVVETAAKGSDENSKPAPKRKSKQPARAAPKRRRKSSVDAN